MQHSGPAEATPEPGDLAAAFCRTLVGRWCDLGVTDAVVCPGSRNTPMSLAMAREGRLEVHVVHDERSAAFLALGLALGSGRPALLTCTSGSAPAHFHPAVLEADLAAVPMLVVTADRPPELQGVLAPQTTDQRDLYGGAVRWYCEPGPPAAGSDPWWPDLAEDAHQRATAARPGPVHLNLGFREPLLPGGIGVDGDGHPGDPGARRELRQRPEPLRPGLTDEDVARLLPSLSDRRGVVVAGARTAQDAAERDVVQFFVGQLGWPLIADATSGLREPHPALVAHFDAILRSGAFAEQPPEVVLRLGGLLTSKALGSWLARSGAVQFGFDRHGMSPDPDRVLARSFPVAPAEALATLAGAGPTGAPREWTEAWRTCARRSEAAVAKAMEPRGTDPVSEPAVARGVLDAMGAGSRLLVASSMPVRDLESFGAPRTGVAVHSNRGTNGIDGMLSTACGVALGSQEPTVLLCGDIAFLHDVGMLSGLARRGADLTVVVVDNDGGGIFHFLPQRSRVDEATFESLWGTPHGLDLVSVVRGFGLTAETVSSRAGLAAALAGAATRGGVEVLVVRTDRDRNVEVHEQLNRSVAEGLPALGPEGPGEPRVSP